MAKPKKAGVARTEWTADRMAGVRTVARGRAMIVSDAETAIGSTYTIDFILKVKLEILCDSDEAGPIVDVIAEAARTGQVGDGKVWVTDISEVVRVRTGESGVAAL